MKDRRKNNQEDILKHLVSELAIANSALQLAQSDLYHFMKNRDVLNEENDIE